MCRCSNESVVLGRSRRSTQVEAIRMSHLPKTNRLFSSKSEFGYCLRQKGRHSMLLVVLELDLVASQEEWSGEIGFPMRGKRFADCSADPSSLFYTRQCDELYDMVLDTICPLEQLRSARSAQLKNGRIDESTLDAKFDGEINYDNLYHRLYADLTSSTLTSQKSNENITERIVQNLAEVKAAATSQESLAVLRNLDVCSLCVSILSLNSDNVYIVKVALDSLTSLCRCGLSSLTENLENIDALVESDICNICIVSVAKHLSNRELVCCGFTLMVFISVTEKISESLCSFGMISLVSKVLHVFYMESDIIEMSAELISISIKLYRASHVEFGRMSCCQFLVHAMGKNVHNDRMILAICNALLSLLISEENRYYSSHSLITAFTPALLFQLIITFASSSQIEDASGPSQGGHSYCSQVEDTRSIVGNLRAI